MEKTKKIKITKAMVLNTIINYFNEDDPSKVLAEIGEAEITIADIVNYAEHTLNQLSAKAEKAKETAAKKKAEKEDLLKQAIMDVLTEEFQTREDILAELDADEDITVSKVGARLNILVKEGGAVKEEVKTVFGRKMCYKLA